MRSVSDKLYGFCCESNVSLCYKLWKQRNKLNSLICVIFIFYFNFILIYLFYFNFVFISIKRLKDLHFNNYIQALLAENVFFHDKKKKITQRTEKKNI